MMALFFFRPELYTQALPHHAHELSITVPHRGEWWNLATPPRPPFTAHHRGEQSYLGAHEWSAQVKLC